MTDLSREQIGLLAFLQDFCHDGIGFWGTDLNTDEGKLSAEGQNEGDSMASRQTDLRALLESGYLVRRPHDHTVYALTGEGRDFLQSLDVPPRLFLGLTVRGNFAAPAAGQLAAANGIPASERVGVAERLIRIKQDLDVGSLEGLEADLVQVLVLPAIDLALTACDLRAQANAGLDLVRAFEKLDAARMVLGIGRFALDTHGVIQLVAAAMELIRPWAGL